MGRSPSSLRRLRMIETNSKRLDQLLETLNDARKSLDNWQDQRTQALINIDSFSYDVRLIQEEKNQILEEYQKCREVFDAREVVLKNQIETLADQVQELKLDKDNLQKDLEISRSETSAARAEIEKHIYAFSNLEEKHAADLVRLKADIELKDTFARKQDTATIEKLTAEGALIQGERDRQEARARRAELELQTLRSQLQTALNHSAGSHSSFEALKNSVHGTHSLAANQSTGHGPSSGVNSTTSVINEPAVANAAGSFMSGGTIEKPARELVQDYLKRLGY